ncbi:hypothetical protein [Bacillus sp. 1P06AnD]|uniref:hypothetical protein n=1 Tax=Bacillus sp. 1P06AnD TaxID=3132208 RepID=UPI0039A08D78
MQNILLQIPVGTTITLGTLDETSGNLQNVTLLGVADFRVTVQMGSMAIMVPICKVTGVAGNGAAAAIIDALVLQPPVDNTGECACCEDPVRRFLQTIATADIDVLGPAFNNIQNATIIGVGEGIVKVQAAGLSSAALSICQISQISDFTVGI